MISHAESVRQNGRTEIFRLPAHDRRQTSRLEVEPDAAFEANSIHVAQGGLHLPFGGLHVRISIIHRILSQGVGDSAKPRPRAVGGHE
jgi:hypothetical protein